MPGTPSKDPHRKMEKAAEVAGDLMLKIDEKYGIMAEILSTIQKVEDARYRTLLISWYINDEPIDMIADRLEVGERQVYRIRNEAEAKVSEIIKCH